MTLDTNINKKNSVYFHLLFGLFILAFAVYKISYLDTPYFWDELQTYGQAANYQYYHGLSLMPGSIDPDFSRGHPTLYFTIHAALMRLFGTGVTVTHSLALLIAVILLALVYRKLTQYYDAFAGLGTVIIFAAQPVFMAQSGMMTPEVPVALFFFLMLTSYYEKKYMLFAIYGAIGVMIKEPVVLFPGAAIAYSVILWIINRERPLGMKPLNILWTCVPWMIFGIFLLIQKKQLGWYFLPLHDEHFLILPFMGKSILGWGYPAYVFVKQQRYLLSLLTGISFLIIFFTQKGRYARLKDGFLLPLGIFSFTYLFFICNSDTLMCRYIVTPVLGLTIAAGILFASLPFRPWLPAALLVILGFTGWLNRDKILITGNEIRGAAFDLDIDLSYAARGYVVRDAARYLEKNSKAGEGVMGPFPAKFVYLYPEAGFLPEGSHLRWGRKADGSLPDYYINDLLPASDGPPGSPAVLETDIEYVDTAKYRLELVKEFRIKENVVQVSRVKRKR